MGHGGWAARPRLGLHAQGLHPTQEPARELLDWATSTPLQQSGISFGKSWKLCQVGHSDDLMKRLRKCSSDSKFHG